MKQVLLTGLMALVAAPAMAAEEVSPYIGIQGQQTTWKQGGFDTGFRADVDAVGALAGVAVNQYVGVEGRYSGGVDGDTVGNVEVDLDRMYGFYLRGTLPTEMMFSPYVIAGYTNAKLEFDGESARDSEDDASWGGGVSLSLDSPLSLDVEWVNYVNKDGFDIEGFNLGLKYRF